MSEYMESRPMDNVETLDTIMSDRDISMELSKDFLGLISSQAGPDPMEVLSALDQDFPEETKMMGGILGPKCFLGKNKKHDRSMCDPGQGAETVVKGGRTLRPRKDVEYNLRTSSVLNRIETEIRQRKPRVPKPKTNPPPLSKYRRKTANARERGRMQDMNDAFEQLRDAVPNFPVDSGKLTKITTLRLAMNYIAELREMLGCDAMGSKVPTTPGSAASTSASATDSCASPDSSSDGDGFCMPFPLLGSTDSLSGISPSIDGSFGSCSGLDSEGESLLSS